MQPVGRVENPPAPAGDLLVREAVDLVQKLLLAASGIDQVRMRIAERGKEHAAPGVHDTVGGDPLLSAAAAEGGDAASVGEQPRVAERLHAVHLRTAQPQPPFALDADDAADIPH